MDQNSTNGSGPDKRNWRERLGVGAKEMPRLSDEFREEPPKDQSAEEAEANKPAPRAAQPVTKPAPMAPRAPKAPVQAAQPAPAPPSPPPRVMPRVPDNAAQEALAEKLRAQRAAAERLAEQRVQAARERAEGRMQAPEPQQPATRSAAPPPPAPTRPAPSAAVRPRAPVPPPPPGARPKFSFAEDPNPARDQRMPPEPPSRPGLGAGAAPLNPPRPALGGERGQPPFLRPAAPGLGARPQPPYRPVEQGGVNGAPPRLQPPPPRGGYGGDASLPPPAYPGARGSVVRRPPALESYPRQSDPRDLSSDEMEGVRQAPRLGRPAPAAPRGRAPQEDFDEVFEDEVAPRQRASARDFQNGYDGEDAFGDEPRRSGGPWLMLLALLAAALVTGGVVWYYNSSVRNVAGTGAPSGEVPVVSAPQDPAKVQPDTSATNGTEAPAAKKKQIYDRIVGEQEVIGGQVQPTEEIPVQPSAAQPADQVPAVEPAAGPNQIPAPDAPDQGADTGLPSVDEPPPLPLPPAGGEQGSLDQKGIERIAAAATARPEQGATAPPSQPLSASSTSSAANLPPPPEKATDGAVLVSDTASAPNMVASAVKPAEPASPAPTAVAMAEPQPEAAPPPVPKKKPPVKKAAAEEPAASMSLGAEPVVLVPPAKVAAADGPSAATVYGVAPEAPAAAPAPEATPKKRTVLDLFRGSDAAAETASQPVQQVAAVEPAPKTAPASKTARTAPQQPAAQPQQQQPTGSGFVIQLASFRSEAEARQEYSRLSGSYPSVVGGLPQQIRQTNVGGSTRYQLGLGPLNSRNDATRVCSALITAGESDCIVRGL